MELCKRNVSSKEWYTHDMPTELIVLIKHQEIERGVARLARTIQYDYLNKNPLLVGILKGSFIFLCSTV